MSTAGQDKERTTAVPVAWWIKEHRQAEGTPEIPGAAELVGWVHRSEKVSSSKAARTVLASALGLQPTELKGIPDHAVVTAVQRLATMVHHYQHVIEEVGMDDLTGTIRRRAGIAALQREIDRARRADHGDVVVAFLDLNGLKKVNDSMGHAAGDQLLCDLVATLKGKLRSYDLIIRWGGDEFVCVLSNSSLEQAERKMQDIAEAFLEVSPAGGGVSFGLSTLRAGDSADTLIARADAQLYERRRAPTETAG